MVSPPVLDPNEPIITQIGKRDDENRTWDPARKEELLADFEYKQLKIRSDGHSRLSSLKGKKYTTPPPLSQEYPTRYQLYKKLHPPSSKKQYTVKITFPNIVLFIFKTAFLTERESTTLSHVNPRYRALREAYLSTRDIDFSSLQHPRHDWKDQTKINPDRVRLLTACLLHYNLDTGLLLRYLGGNTMGEYTDPHRAL